MQIDPKADSYRVGFCQPKTAFFDLIPNRAFLHSRKRAFSTQLFSAEFSDWGIQSKNSVEKVSHVFFQPIASLIPPQNTHPHAHTPIYQVPHSMQQRRLWPGCHCCSFSPQVSVAHSLLVSSVYHTTAAAHGIDAILPTTATPAVALAALG